MQHVARNHLVRCCIEMLRAFDRARSRFRLSTENFLKSVDIDSKGGKFLKKRDAASVEEYNMIIWFY